MSFFEIHLINTLINFLDFSKNIIYACYANSLLNGQIKADVETQGEFVNSLIQEVNNAMYQNIEDVVAFVKWLDDELCFLVSLSLQLFY